MNTHAGILLVATRRYKIFLKPLLEQIDKFFLPKEELTVFLFTDEEYLYDESKYDFVIKQFQIPSYGFPDATILRYKTFHEHYEAMKNCSHLYYLDVDMKIVASIGDEFLVDGLIAVRHPGTYATDRWGSPNNSKISMSWFPEEKRKHYYCGGVQGGKSEHYLHACEVLCDGIEIDRKNGVMAEWHDESFWNFYTNFQRPDLVTELSPAYCMPESKEHQVSWGLSEFTPIIIALNKNHKEMRG